MGVFEQVFSLCTQVLNLTFTLFGFKISLFALFTYSMIGYFLIKVFMYLYND